VPPMSSSYAAFRTHLRRMMETNFFSAAHASYCAAQIMAKAGRGRIVNVGSRGAFRGEPDAPGYGASKAALHQLTQSLAQALAPSGISVFAVAPGFVETAMARPHMTDEKAEAVKAQSPFGRIASVEDVAYFVGCLAAPEAAFASGAIVDVNGASYLRT
jgi:3-oxoacyl-[acyl-carrier protein] reductase